MCCVGGGHGQHCGEFGNLPELLLCFISWFSVNPHCVAATVASSTCVAGPMQCLTAHLNIMTFVSFPRTSNPILCSTYPIGRQELGLVSQEFITASSSNLTFCWLHTLNPPRIVVWFLPLPTKVMWLNATSIMYVVFVPRFAHNIVSSFAQHNSQQTIRPIIPSLGEDDCQRHRFLHGGASLRHAYSVFRTRVRPIKSGHNTRRMTDSSLRFRKFWHTCFLHTSIGTALTSLVVEKIGATELRR